jgi:hypothetical protein
MAQPLSLRGIKEKKIKEEKRKGDGTNLARGNKRTAGYVISHVAMLWCLMKSYTSQKKKKKTIILEWLKSVASYCFFLLSFPFLCGNS